ncbi:MAG TPA: YggS family pyridoxal phosphate-dependent enzyme [Steroidobacteraceae bacterium]|nr:YggS family pyridoxal phosphate-dependent enzyme [Steroidobacteraceae bacterium]
MLIDPQNSADAGRIAGNLARLRARIRAAAAQSGRSVDQITLVGASKGQSAAAIAAAVGAGLHDFGESYVQDALPKMAALAASPPPGPLVWHFIGGLQANKTRAVAENFAWVHGVDRLRIAARLSGQRPHYAPPLNVCVQVRIGAEAGKGGAEPAGLPQLLRDIAALPRLRLRGLMCLPPPESDPVRQRYWLHQLRELFESANAGGAGLDTLSMGMSADLEAAIEEGATMVRVGTDLFGPRVAPPSPSHIQSTR